MARAVNDFQRVRVIRSRAQEGSGGAARGSVGEMGVSRMNVEKKGRLRAVLEPALHPTEERARRKIHLRPPRTLFRIEAEDIEAAIVPEYGGSKIVRDEGRSMVAVALQRFRYGNRLGADSVFGLDRAVVFGIEPGQNGCRGRQSERALRNSMAEEHSGGGECVYPRTRRARVAVAAQAIRPQGIDQVENHVRAAARVQGSAVFVPAGRGHAPCKPGVPHQESRLPA